MKDAESRLDSIFPGVFALRFCSLRSAPALRGALEPLALLRPLLLMLLFFMMLVVLSLAVIVASAL